MFSLLIREKLSFTNHFNSLHVIKMLFQILNKILEALASNQTAHKKFGTIEQDNKDRERRYNVSAPGKFEVYNR